jgi:glutamate receptor, ionotropic, invertebrate
VLCSSIDALPEILKQAQQVGLMTDDHQIIITSLDMHTIDLEPFQYSGANITGFRLVNPEDPFVKEKTKKFQSMNSGKTSPKENKIYNNDNDVDEAENSNSENQVEIPDGLTAEKLQLNTALTFDAVLLLHKVLSQHKEMKVLGIDCEDPKSIFENGTSIFNSMKTIAPFKGLSGEIQFDQHGNRENFQLDLLELTSEGLQKTGTWNETKGIHALRGKLMENGNSDPNDLRNKTLIVMTVEVRFSFEYFTRNNSRFNHFRIIRTVC